MPRVEIYTKMMCPYCVRAKRLLSEKGVEYEEYDITLGGPKRAEMMERANGGYTVPQIFINGRHVGGSDDLAALDREGRAEEHTSELQSLMRISSAVFCLNIKK